jgi:hypothetical protein
LKGGGYGFLFRSEKFFRTTQELECLFFMSRKARNFFPEFNIRLYDKYSESDYFFIPPPKSEYFFQQLWESEYFFYKKKHNPPLFKLNGRSLSLFSLVVDTSSVSILYIIISLASFLLFDKGLHLSLWSMLLTLDRFLWLLATYLAALLCTASILFISVFV